jgi:hypothetical protein
MLRKIIIALAASVALVVSTGGAALAGGHHYPPPPEKCYDTVHHDAVTHEETVVDVEAYDEKVIDQQAQPAVDALWWNWSPNKDQGPFDGPPSFPTDERGTWEGPHHNGGPDQDTTGTFNSSNSDNGRASWFHRIGGSPALPEISHLVHHDAVTHTITVVDVEAYDERVEVPCEPECPTASAATFGGHYPPPPSDDCEEEPTLVVPDILVPKDLCGTENDHYALPASTDAVTYWREGRDIIAALTDPEGTAWSIVAGSGWTFDDANTIRYTFPTRGGPFTDVPCEQESTPVTPTISVFDECGVIDDHFVLSETEGITYTEVEGWIIATPNEGYAITPESIDTNGFFILDEDGTAHADIDWFFSDEPCQTIPTGIPFSVTPAPATCTAAGSFDAGALGGEFNEETQQWGFENVDAEVLFDNPEDGDVTINVFAHEGYVIDDEGLSDEWFIEAGGARASITFTLEAQLSGPVACPLTTTPTPTPVTPTPTVTTTTVVVYTSTPAAPTSSTLASTGSNAWFPGIAAGILALAGITLTLIKRRALR